MSEKKYQQCTRCVMDTSDPEIIFDDNGNCNHCNHFLTTISLRKDVDKAGEASLDNIVKKIKHSGRGKEYDCILGISGGVDSCYTAYVLKKLGLRTLLVHLDNGWNSEKAVQNIKSVAEKLQFDYESYVLNWEEFKDLQLSFLKASVIEADTPTDMAIIGCMHEVAVKYKVKYVISGGNITTEGILPRLWHYNAKDTRYFKSIHQKFGTRKLRKFPSFGYAKEIYYKLIKRIKIVYLLNYVPYNIDEVRAVLSNELGLKDYTTKHHESIFTAFIQSYLLPVKFNLDYRRATLSTQICIGEITREAALKILEQLPYDPATIKEKIAYVSKKLGISVAEFDALLHLPVKTYRDYPNDEKKLNFLYKLYRKIYHK